MENLFYELIIKNSPIGFAYHKIILDSVGKPCDYIFLQVNYAFEKMTGLKGDQIIGKRITEVLPEIIKEEKFDYIATYGITALKGETSEYEQYSTTLQRWYRIHVYSPKQYYFVVNLLDISKGKQQVAKYKKLLHLLKKNELQFHHIIDNLPFSLIITHKDGTILYTNAEGIKLFELNDDTKNKNILSLWVDPQDRLRFIKAIEEKSLVKDFEMHMHTKAGKNFWIMSTGMMIKYQNQLCMLSTHHDITNRKNMEIALKVSEEKFRLIFENSAEIILIVQNNKIQICNPMIYKVLGYSPQEMYQAPFIDFIHPEDHKYALNAYYGRLAEKNISYKTQYRAIRKDDKIVWIEANGVKINWNSHPAIQYFIIDITQQKKAKDALQSSEEKYRLITEFASDMIWVFNYTNYKLTYVSPSVFNMLGYLPEEILELDIINIIPKEFLNKLEAMFPPKIKKFLKNFEIEHSYIMEMQNIHKNGQRIWVESSSKYRYNNKKEIEIIGVSRNIEERKNAEQKVLYLSYHDQLTGLYNRRFYEEELKRLDTIRNLPITLIIADVNGLKLTNDAFGHMAGDQLLVRIAQILKRECRSDDIIARIGGDEFIILLPETHQEHGNHIISRIQKYLASEKFGTMILSVSFGSATKKTPVQDMESIFIEAENVMYQHKLTESNNMRNETIKIITQKLYTKSKSEKAHTRRVSKLCGEIAKAMEMSEEAINEIITAGFVHDIGKIGMEEKILDKLEPFTDEELTEYKRHPEKGYQILKASSDFAQIAKYVLCHHEHVNGRGYPRGLTREDIPIQSKILSIADAYDCMTNPRGCQKGMDEDSAIEEIKKNIYKKFDPIIARVFVKKVLNKPWD